jgi:hypothetical protein
MLSTPRQQQKSETSYSFFPLQPLPAPCAGARVDLIDFIRNFSTVQTRKIDRQENL